MDFSFTKGKKGKVIQGMAGPWSDTTARYLFQAVELLLRKVQDESGTVFTNDTAKEKLQTMIKETLKEAARVVWDDAEHEFDDDNEGDPDFTNPFGYGWGGHTYKTTQKTYTIPREDMKDLIREILEENKEKNEGLSANGTKPTPNTGPNSVCASH